MQRTDLEAAAAVLVARSVLAQGLPTNITDPTILRRVAGVLTSGPVRRGVSVSATA